MNEDKTLTAHDRNKTATYSDGTSNCLSPEDFKTYISQYITGAREHQAIPVLVAPPPRRTCDANDDSKPFGNGTGASRLIRDFARWVRRPSRRRGDAEGAPFLVRLLLADVVNLSNKRRDARRRDGEPQWSRRGTLVHGNDDGVLCASVGGDIDVVSTRAFALRREGQF